MCPEAYRQLCTGKEGFPVLSFQVVVDHFRRVHYCSDAFLGHCNDIEITNNDDYPRRIRNGKYTEVVSYLLKADGTVMKCYGAYLLTDGGYPNEMFFINPDHFRVSRDEVLWSEWLESIRKDVECTFGIIKQRFRFLKYGVFYHHAMVIQNAMRTACGLHNMLLAYDGLDGEDADWENINPEDDEPEVDVAQGDAEPNVQEYEAEHNLREQRIEEVAVVLHERRYRRSQKEVLKEDLRTHFAAQFRRGELQWPKGFSGRQRALMPLSRAHRELAHC